MTHVLLCEIANRFFPLSRHFLFGSSQCRQHSAQQRAGVHRKSRHRAGRHGAGLRPELCRARRRLRAQRLQGDEPAAHHGLAGQGKGRPESSKVNYYINPLVPRVQKIKIRKLALNRLLIVEFVKKMVYHGGHYSERQGLIG